MSNLPKVRQPGRVERFINRYIRLETEEEMLARERDNILEQVFSLQLLKNMRPAFIKVGNSLKTTDHPEIDNTNQNYAILATEPLVEGEGPESKRTYVMWVEKLSTFVGVTFKGESTTSAEDDILSIIEDTISGKRPQSRPTE